MSFEQLAEKIKKKHKNTYLAEFKELFGADHNFLDVHCSIIFDFQYAFDIIAFDDWCHEEHGYDEDEHGSLEDFVRLHWGDKHVAFLNYLQEGSKSDTENTSQAT